METIHTDICVIGAGSAGLSVAAGAVQMGARTVLIEGGEMGGDCLNRGCVPSKALLAAAQRAQQVRQGGFGIAPQEPVVDMAMVRAHVAGTIAAIAPHDSQERFEGLGVTVLRAFARFTGPDRLVAGDREVRARRFVIATGSAPRVPDLPGLAGLPYLTNETLFDLPELPDHLLILGGGPVGIEMAQAHRRLGARVTVVTSGAALPRDDPEMAGIVLARLRAEGIEIVEHARAVRAGGAAGAVWIETADGARHAGSHLLVAVGRRPDLDRLDLAAAGVERTQAGVRVDARLRSTNRRIHAIGDAAGGLQFTHLAGYQAGVILRAMLFALPARAGAPIPRVTYTDPELAQVGLTEARAREVHGPRLEVIRKPLAANDRARAQGQRDGAIKLMAVGGRPVGVTIAGPGAGEMIALWQLALAQRLKLGAIAGMVAPYPTLSELSKGAAGAYFSPRLFESATVKRIVRLVQRFAP